MVVEIALLKARAVLRETSKIIAEEKAEHLGRNANLFLAPNHIISRASTFVQRQPNEQPAGVSR